MTAPVPAANPSPAANPPPAANPRSPLRLDQLVGRPTHDEANHHVQDVNYTVGNAADDNGNVYKLHQVCMYYMLVAR